MRVHGPSAKNYSHEDINALQSEISATNEALARKKDDIAVFQGLPPDLDLAEFRLQESKAEYEALQGQFAKLREALADRYYE